MISGWRLDRRIGPTSLAERLLEHQLGILVVVGGSFVIATGVLLIRIVFGDLPHIEGRVEQWSLTFVFAGILNIYNVQLRRKDWLPAAFTATLIFLIAFAVWRFTIPILIQLGWAEQVIYVGPLIS